MVDIEELVDIADIVDEPVDIVDIVDELVDIVDIDTGHLSTAGIKGNRVNFIDNKLIILQE